jgi:parvulin-like peptidyl-prolyl isomerase
MKRPAFWIATVVACALGICCAQILIRALGFRDLVAELFHGGHLLALVDGHGIYQADVRRLLAETDYVAGIEKEERTETERQEALSELIANRAADVRAAREKIPRPEQAAEVNALRFQFPDDKSWRTALKKSVLTSAAVSRIVGDNLKTREWLDKQIASATSVISDECRQFYDSHRDEFLLPERRRVSHLFLAAPPETPPDVIETKRAAIEALSARLAAGEDFATLAAQNSEDEATKLSGGDLGYFSAKRMPPDFIEAAFKLHPGEISKPVQTRLGFHILKLVDVQGPRRQTFDEVQADIAVIIANEKRTIALKTLTADLRRDPAYLRQF